MAHKTDTEIIATTHNTARFFTEHRQISVVALAAVFVWGWFGYTHMPKRKDPDIPVRVAVAMCAWPGVNAQQVEQLVTRPMEETIAQNKNIHPGTASDIGIMSTSLPGLSIVTAQSGGKSVRRQHQDAVQRHQPEALQPERPAAAGRRAHPVSK